MHSNCLICINIIIICIFTQTDKYNVEIIMSPQLFDVLHSVTVPPSSSQSEYCHEVYAEVLDHTFVKRLWHWWCCKHRKYVS